MTIADLTAHILYHYANNVENYPTILEPLAVTDELKVVEKLMTHLQDKMDSIYETEDGCGFYDEADLRLQVLQRDFTAKELLEELEEVYLSPEYPALDIWVEDVKGEYYNYAPHP